jgi:DNA-binding CsgD family transcriptional regulator
LYRTTTQLARQLTEMGVPLEDVLDDIAATLTLLDAEGRIVWQNEASLARVGDRRGDSYLTLLAPEHRHGAAKELERLRTVAGGWSRRPVVVAADRRRVRSLSIVIPLRTAGEFSGVLALGLPLDDDAPQWSLTPRQLETLSLLADGRSTSEIAQALCISLETARNHIRRLLRALDAHSRLEAVARGRELGILEDGPAGDEWHVSAP